MSTPTKLFDSYKLGPITLPNRLVMAPLTRNRAVEGLVHGLGYSEVEVKVRPPAVRAGTEDHVK